MADADLLTRMRSSDDERVLDVAITEHGMSLRAATADTQRGIEARTGMAPSERAELRNRVNELTTHLRIPAPD